MGAVPHSGSPSSSPSRSRGRALSLRAVRRPRTACTVLYITLARYGMKKGHEDERGGVKTVTAEEQMKEMAYVCKLCWMYKMQIVLNFRVFHV